MATQQPTVALVVPDFPVGGGVRAMAQFLCRAISESQRYQVDIVSLALSSRDRYSLCLRSPRSWFRGPRIVRDDWNGYALYRAGARFAELEFQRYQPRSALTRFLNRYDLIQVVAGTPAWALATRDVERPVCLFVATTTHKERVAALKRRKGLRRYWFNLMTTVTVRIDQTASVLVDYVVAESEYTHAALATLLPSDRLSLGLPGIDTELFAPATYQRGGYIISVARFSDPRKNVRLLFEAYRHLRQQVPDAPRLLLAGNRPTPEDWEYAVSLQISAWIDCPGSLSPQELAPLYRQASLFVLSSDEEGLGIVILEAMASGLPVVSTRCGGPETAVIEGETGCLTPVGDAQALAQAMQRLLADPDLCMHMGHRAREVAEERFSISAAGKVFLECYDVLLDRRG